MCQQVFVCLQACQATSARIVSLCYGETLPPFPKVFLSVEILVA